MTYQYPCEYLRTDWGVDTTESYGHVYSSATFPQATYTPVLFQTVTYPPAAYRAAYQVPSDYQNGASVYPAPALYNTAGPTTTQLPSTGQGFGHQPQSHFPKKKIKEISSRRDHLLGDLHKVSKPTKSSTFSRYEAADKRQQFLSCQDRSYQCDEKPAGCIKRVREKPACMYDSSHRPSCLKPVRGIHPHKDTQTEEQQRIDSADLATPKKSHTRNQLQPRALSDSKAENQVSKQHEDYETHNSTTRSLSDPAAPLSEDLNSRIRLIGNRFKYPLFILHLIHKHEIDTMDAFKRSYESVFNSLSDTQSSGLLGTWLHSLSDASDYQCNPFWWPSQIDFNKDQEQKPEDMKKILRHMACGNHGSLSVDVLKRLRACLPKEGSHSGSWQSIKEVLVLRMVELSCLQVNVYQKERLSR